MHNTQNVTVCNTTVVVFTATVALMFTQIVSVQNDNPRPRVSRDSGMRNVFTLQFLEWFSAVYINARASKVERKQTD